jgi:hypothetical protein
MSARHDPGIDELIAEIKRLNLLVRSLRRQLAAQPVPVLVRKQVPESAMFTEPKP